VVPAGRAFLPLYHPDKVAEEITAAIRDVQHARPAA
jgi:hypothetical protein